MKLTMKKGALTLGTVAAIAAPIAAVISCGSTEHNTINWDGTNDKFAGVSGNDFLTEIKHLGKTKQNAITIGREQMMQLQYESESIRSLSGQVEKLRYQNWQTKMDNKKLVQEKADVVKEQTDNPDADQSTKDGYKDKIDSIDDQTKDNDKKIKDTEALITTLDGVLSKLDLSGEFLQDKDDALKNFYANDYKSEDFPEVYKPLSVIRSEKSDIVNDSYRQFYPQFTTRKDGDAEWPAELASQYGGAATFGQAIDYLVTQEVSSKAFNSYKFEINKDFTVEQKLWAQYIDKNSFKFLIEDGADVAGSQHDPELNGDINLIQGFDAEATGFDPATVDVDKIEDNILKVNRGETLDGLNAVDDKTKVKASVLSSTEIFIGSTSPDHRMPKDAYTELGGVVKYQHLLIKATQGKTPEEAWTIKGEDLQKLMEFDQYDDGSGTTISQGLDFLTNTKLFSDTSGDDANKFTDFVLKAISGNSAGTLNIQGSLGIKSETEYLKTMVSGFSLGALAMTQGTGTDVAGIADINLKVLQDNLKKVLEAEVQKIYPTFATTAVDAKSLDTVDNQIENVITTLGDDKVKTIFGKVFSDFFKDKKDLIYKVGSTGNYLVISQYGIHIIKRTSYNDGAAIKSALEGDMKDMAKDSSLGSSTSLVAELNAHYTDTKVMELLIAKEAKKGADGSPVNDASGNPVMVESPFGVALTSKLAEYNKNKEDEVDKVTMEDIRDVITSVNKLKDQSDVDTAIGDKLENWLVTQIDSDLRTIGTTKLSDIYGWAQVAGGIK